MSTGGENGENTETPRPHTPSFLLKMGKVVSGRGEWRPICGGIWARADDVETTLAGAEPGDSTEVVPGGGPGSGAGGKLVR